MTQDPEVVSAARTLAEWSVLLLGVAVVALGLAVVAIIAAVRFARHHRQAFAALVGWCYRQLQRVPVAAGMLGRIRRIAPPSYLALHLILGFVVTAAVVGFLVVAEEVFAGREVAAFDRAFSEAIVQTTSPRWRNLFAAITWLGSAVPLSVLGLIVAALLVIGRHYTTAAWWIIAQVGAGALVLTLKAAFARSRPEFAYESGLARGWGFPSGHALRTFVFCGLGAYLVFRYSRSWIATVVVAAAALAFGLVVAFSRVYLGAHFLTDVLAGLIAATAWVAVCVSGIEVGLRRANQRLN